MIIAGADGPSATVTCVMAAGNAELISYEITIRSFTLYADTTVFVSLYKHHIFKKHFLRHRKLSPGQYSSNKIFLTFSGC